MFLATLIVILSTELVYLCYLGLESTCQRILRRRFGRDYFRPVAHVNRLEFPSLQKALKSSGAELEYSRVAMVLRCDFLSLTYLLKNSANFDERYTFDDLLLILYFRVGFMLFTLRHSFGLREVTAVMHLTFILKYFANVVGERAQTLRFRDVPVFDTPLELLTILPK
jgi:hypothetical protein